MRGLWMAVVAGLVGTGAAMADPVPVAAAKKMLYPAKTPLAVVIRKNSGLADDQAQILATVGKGQPYYGAIAFSPDEGIMVEATVAAVNHHSVEAAEAAAVAECDTKRKGKAHCVVAVILRPDGWEARPLQLSQAATEALRKDYGRSGERALAVSALTGAFGTGTGTGAAEVAVKACAKSGAEDCQVVVQD